MPSFVIILKTKYDAIAAYGCLLYYLNMLLFIIVINIIFYIWANIMV